MTNKNKRLAIMVNENGRAYLEALAKDYNLTISEVIRTALEVASADQSKFENRLAAREQRF